jgi:hypothetical protein
VTNLGLKLARGGRLQFFPSLHHSNVLGEPIPTFEAQLNNQLSDLKESVILELIPYADDGS